VAGRCAECGFDADDYNAMDSEGTMRALAVRWSWVLEGLSDAERRTPGASGRSAADHLQANLDVSGSADAADAVRNAPRTAEVLHAAEHHLHAAGRIVAEIGAGTPTMTGCVERINSSTGGVPKSAVPSASVTWRGLAGDVQATRRHHGRPTQALSLWSADVIDDLAAEGHPIGPGCAGENITVRDVDWARVRTGAIVEVGDALAMITGWADPCSNLTPWFIAGDFRRIDHERHPGMSRAYASVLRPGTVHAGDAVTFEP
jgi:MOSC domain-containing protein YiiM